MNSKLENLKNLCRVCLNNKDNSISLLEIHQIKEISEKIEQCSGVRMLSTEGLPSLICQCCAKELAICYRFLEKCRESDKELQRILEIQHTEAIYSNRENSNVNNSPLFISSVEEIATHEEHSSDSGKRSPEIISSQKQQKNRLKPRLKKKHRERREEIQGRQHTCEVCGKSFSSSSNLRVHQRIHSGSLPFRCKECGRAFGQQGSLAAHIRRHSGERPFRCTVCPAAFAERTHLRRHASVHSAERPFVCAACGKALKSSFALKQHVQLHSARREHICDQCGATFTAKGNLVAHIRARHSEHSGQCSVCHCTVPNLHEHMPLHTGERPHTCPTCDKSFTRRRGLLVHSRQHSDASKFACTVEGCDRSFQARWVLDCHLLKHSGTTPFVCTICSKGFTRVCHLTKHFKLNHPNESDEVVVKTQ